eukprot:g9956.t1
MFKGEFDDFSNEWYASVGTPLLITLAMNAVTPHIAPVTQYFVVAPLKRCLLAKGKATQRDLNLLQAGPQFEVTTRSAQLLNHVVTTMVFAPGLPLLWPIAFAACFTFYYVDLFLLLKFYQRPPSYNEKIGKFTISVFEIAVFVNILFCIWSYGNQSVLASQSVMEGGTSAYSEFRSYAGIRDDDDVTRNSTRTNLFSNSTNSTGSNGGGYMNRISILHRHKSIEGTIFSTMIDRISRAHTFFLFMLLLALFFYKIINSFFHSIWASISSVFCPGRSANTTLRFNPPLTSTFKRPLDPLIKHHTLETLKKIGFGWTIEECKEKCDLGLELMFQGDRKFLVKKDTANGKLKKTWEVIKESGLHTYDIADNPKYADVMRFLNDHNKQRASRIAKGLTLNNEEKREKRRQEAGFCRWDNFFVCCATS